MLPPIILFPHVSLHHPFDSWHLQNPSLCKCLCGWSYFVVDPVLTIVIIYSALLLSCVHGHCGHCAIWYTKVILIIMSLDNALTHIPFDVAIFQRCIHNVGWVIRTAYCSLHGGDITASLFLNLLFVVIQWSISVSAIARIPNLKDIKVLHRGNPLQPFENAFSRPPPPPTWKASNSPQVLYTSRNVPRIDKPTNTTLHYMIGQFFFAG